MVGSETSILVGVIAVGIGMGLGVILGMLSGYFGGWLDEAFMRLMDAVQGFPAILSALLITAVFKPSVVISMVAIGVTFLPVFARLTRASFLELRDREFVVAARALGAGDGALIGRHILPNTLAPLIVQATISFPVAILAEAALSYLGLGTQPPHPSWGLMLREAQAFLGLSPSFAIFPGTAIALTVLGFNLLGDGLRDLLDPKMMS
jgi:peptide/nickel transport system permease protein